MRHENLKYLPDHIEKEEELYRRANELSRKLKIPFTELILGISVIKKDGTRKPVLERHSRSLVRNFYTRHLLIISGAANASGYTDGGLQAKNIAGTLISPELMSAQGSMQQYGFHAAAADATTGIQIGTGSTAESFDDYVIETLIEHGLTAGKMGYLTTAHTKGWNAGGNYYYKNFERVMDNDSGSTINVTESTIVWNTQLSAYGEFLFSHDVFAAVAILYNEGIAIFYEFRTTYP